MYSFDLSLLLHCGISLAIDKVKYGQMGVSRDKVSICWGPFHLASHERLRIQE